MICSRPGSVGDYSASASTFSGNDNLLYATSYVHYAVRSAFAQAKITRSGRRDDHVAFRALIALRERDDMPSAVIGGNGLRSCFQTSGAWFLGDEAPHTPREDGDERNRNEGDQVFLRALEDNVQPRVAA